MKRATLLFFPLLLAAQASAQNLSAYQALATHLETAATASQGTDPLATLKELDAAQVALDQLTPTLSNPKLVSGLHDTVDAARAAQSRTPTELQAQVLLARGLMRKALYDQTISVLATSPANGMERLGVLAKELGADPAALKADAQAGRLNLVTWRLQKAATAKLSSALSKTEATQTPAAYLNLARATSWFTVVQEAGRALSPSLDVPDFTQALTQLSTGDTTTLQGSLSSLRGRVAALSQSLAAVPAAVVKAPKTPTTTPVTPAPSTAPTGATPTTSTTSSALPADQQPARTVLVKDGLSQAYAALSRAQTAAGHADMPTAREQLSAVDTSLASAPAALRSAAGYDTFIQHVQAMQGRKGLRPGDIQALSAELGTLEDRAAGRPTSVLDNLSGSTSRTLGGGVRAILALLLALACAAPLYLLNLAFGGKNPFWRAISAALALWMLPAFLEGVFGFLGWLGDLMGVGFLRSLTNLTLSQGLYGLPWRGLINLLAIALATYGFRGLCVQFGLLGGAPRKTANTTSLGHSNATQTSLDWDEDV